MKTNKKIVLAFAMTMIFSLGLMQGVIKNENKQDMNLQQVSVAAGYFAGMSEGGASSAWTAVSALAGSAAVGAAYGGLTNFWNPLGPAGLLAGGALAL
tara:strand:- start:1324 stop:1617 length:294 start_codon:yes stop_codon:yes gene_type:complete